MKKPIAIVFNDAHLEASNEREVVDSVRHLLKYAKSKKITNLIFAGDMFESRSHQRQSELTSLDEILNLIHKAKCTLYLFPGNHDKSVYKSRKSFLDVYRHHPCVKFNRELKNIVLDGISIDLLPFFSDDVLIPILKKADGADVLVSHFEMAGSTHLGKTSEKISINKRLLKKWKKVYLGHYHNTHEISKDIVHLPSLRQNDFGEDNNKGFTVLYDDLSYGIVKGVFREFKKLSINIDSTSTAEIKKLIKTHENNPGSIRFEFTGDRSKLDALDKAQFKNAGIDLKKKYEKKYDYDKELIPPKVIESYDEDQIEATFKDFCEDKGYDHDKGKVLLEEFLKKKENVETE